MRLLLEERYQYYMYLAVAKSILLVFQYTVIRPKQI